MILDLDDEASLDPERVGSKVMRLAMGRRADLPVLPGFVVEGESSRHHMELGAETLMSRGSGGARLAVVAEPVPFADDLISQGASLGISLVARSSTTLEGSGEWSGAFTSYLDLTPSDLPKAIAGCWAAAFSVEALNRQTAAGIEPGSFLMPVLVQPALGPESGGTAEIKPDAAIVVYGVKGSPAPLLQGWIAALEARQVDQEGEWTGEELIDLVGTEALDSVTSSLREAHRLFGANRCEWAIDGKVWILQLDVVAPAQPALQPTVSYEEIDPGLIKVARLAMIAPGKLGEELVIPWALAGLPERTGPIGEQPDNVLERATELCGQLTSQAWGLAPDEALHAARECVRGLRGPDPTAALEQVGSLNTPDPTDAAVLCSLVDVLCTAMVDTGAVSDPAAAWHLSSEQIRAVISGTRRAPEARIGIGQWEPLVASVVLGCGTQHQGTPASPGIGAGVRSIIDNASAMGLFSPREVVTAPQAIPNLAPLLWNAAGLVTGTGSPTAHLFESARSLGVPAVCGVTLPGDPELIVAVDGHTGLVATLPLRG